MEPTNSWSNQERTKWIVWYIVPWTSRGTHSHSVRVVIAFCFRGTRTINFQRYRRSIPLFRAFQGFHRPQELTFFSPFAQLKNDGKINSAQSAAKENMSLFPDDGERSHPLVFSTSSLVVPEQKPFNVLDLLIFGMRNIIPAMVAVPPHLSIRFRNALKGIDKDFKPRRRNPPQGPSSGARSPGRFSGLHATIPPTLQAPIEDIDFNTNYLAAKLRQGL